MKLLDLFCGAGGAAMGYHQAGFTEIIGVDLEPQPDYPFTFRCADWFNALHQCAELHAQFDLIHASPPCQDYTPMSNRFGSMHPRLITAVRTELRQLYPSTPFVIENVAGSRTDLKYPIELTGEMFGLEVHRPRLFELGNWYTLAPSKPRAQHDPVSVYGPPDGRRLWTRTDGTELRAWSSIAEGQQALGIDWTDDWHQIREAIPPAYTRFIGEQFMAQYA